MTSRANPHLARAPVSAGQPLDRARLACVLVHGRDQDECVMLDVVERLDLDDVAYLLPVAAERSWYPGRYFDPPSKNEPHLTLGGRSLRRGARRGERRWCRRGARRGRWLLAGRVRNRRTAGSPAPSVRRRGGSDRLAARSASERTTPAGVDGLRMFFALSRYDEWIALQDARATAQAFERSGATVAFEVHDDRVHHINDRAIAGLRALLSAG